jgi:hypothetical protein
MYTRELDDKKVKWFKEIWKELPLKDRTEIRRIACQGNRLASLSEQETLMYHFLMAKVTDSRTARTPVAVIHAIKTGLIKI